MSAIAAIVLVVTIVMGSFAFTNGKNNKTSLVSIYYNTGNGEYTATPPSDPLTECSLNDPYPCTITLNTAIDEDTYPTFTYRGVGDNTLSAASDGISEVSPNKRKSPY